MKAFLSFLTIALRSTPKTIRPVQMKPFVRAGALGMKDARIKRPIIDTIRIEGT